MKLLFVTIPTDEAEALVDILLDERLIAGANMIPNVKSKYRWQDKIEVGNETVLFMETNDSLVKKTIKRISELHGCDVPKIIALDVNDVYQPYLKCLLKETVCI